MSRIALIGASGAVGSRVLKEMSERGHTVTAIARNPEKIATLDGVTAQRGDTAERAALASLLKGHDAVVSAVRFSSCEPADLLEAVRAADVNRYLVVGGAGSLMVASGKRLMDQPDIPESYLPEASRGAAFLDLLRKETELDWTFLSPSAEFFSGVRTGKFRLGMDTLLSDEHGSRISYEDYSVALVDEIEHPAHPRQRFTVGY